MNTAIKSTSSRTTSARSLFDPAILRRAVRESFGKLNPRLMVRNPVMFVVEVGSVLTTMLFLRDLQSSSVQDNLFFRSGGGLAVVHGVVRQLR